MKRHFYFLLLFCLCTCTLPINSKTRKNIKEHIDWPQFMQKQDLIWEVLPEYWYESSYMGNGKLGLMIYKEPNQNYIRFETGNCDVHDHRPGGGSFSVPRLLTGHFALYPEGEITGGSMRLDLWNAETTAQITTTKGTIDIHALVHADDMLMIINTTASKGEEKFRWEWIPASADSPRWLFAKANPDWKGAMPKSYQGNPAPEVKPGLSVQKLPAGGETAVAWQKSSSQPDKRTYWISVIHSYPELTAEKESREVLEKAQNAGYAQLQKTHRAWWNGFYPASFLTLPDGVKENFYWIQLYKLASATRGDRALIDNTGPWLTVTPWPNAWMNLNVQLTYWTLNTSNHLDLAASLENAFYNHTENLRNNLPEAYRKDAFGIGRSSNGECVTETVGIPGISPTPEVGLLPWICHNLWLIYRHKMDDTLLKEKLFPLLKGSVNYYLYFLRKEEDGKLHLPKTYSPEYGNAEDCNFDLSLLRWSCQTLLEITKRLNISDPLIPRWQETLNELTPYPVDPDNGLMIGRNVPYAFSHRHYSHLLAIYPLYIINNEQTGGKELIEKSLNYWQSKEGALLGYSLTGASSISSAIGKGNDALKYLDKLFGKFLSVNTLYRESGPVIETPLSGAQSIHDMLLQSWGGKLRIFPAVPDAWKDIAYRDWRTEGAFLVAASRKTGKTEFINIKSLAGEPCIVVTDILSPVFKGANKEYKVNKLGENTYQIDLKKGEEVLIYANGTNPEFEIHPIENQKVNCFGKKKAQL